MRQFVGLTIEGCILLLLLCVGAVAAGRVQPAPDVIPGLTECNGLPCYRGIVLNKTTIKDAQAILTRLPGAALGPNSGIVLLREGPIEEVYLFTGSIGVQTDADIVREIQLEMRPNAIQAGALIAYAGTPCNIHVYPPSFNYPNEMTIGYSMMGLWLEPDRWVLYPQMPVTQINLVPDLSPTTANSDSPLPPCQPADLAPELRWQGLSLSGFSLYDKR